MAKSIRAVRDLAKEGNDRAKKSADKHFGGKENGAKKDPVKVMEALATERDAQHHFGQIKRAEKAKAKAYEEAASLRTEAKTDLDKVYADAADALKSRGVTKRILHAIYELSNRKQDEAVREARSENWMVRAIGLPCGQMTFLFDEPVKDAADAKAKARQAGFDASAEGKSSADNVYTGHAELNQEFLAGYHEHQAQAAQGFRKPVESAEGERPN